MRTAPTPQPVDLGPETAIHLGAELDVTAFAVTSTFWTHDPADHPQLAHGRILSVFDYTTTWPYWERHPTGDELVYVLSGDVEFHLDDDHQDHAVTLRAGQAVIVPAGTWHRARIHAPSRLLFVTPTPQRTQQRPAGTENEHDATIREPPPIDAFGRR
jgi:mannose-6-phosphate isomerase-like protein (cupin superfamily)